MAKEKGNKNKSKKARRVHKRALRDVRLSLEPQLEAIAREESWARRNYEDMLAQAQGIYDALARELAPLGPAYQQQAQGISDALLQQLGEFASLLGTDTPQGETEAANALYQTIGSGGLSTLASQMARNLAYQTSAERQAAIERGTVARNLLQDLQDALDALSERRLQVTDDMDALVRQRIDQLKEMALTRQLARSQIASERALSEFLQGQIGGLLGGRAGGRVGGGRVGGGRAGGGPPQGAEQQDVLPGPPYRERGQTPKRGPEVPEGLASSGIMSILPPVVREWLRGDLTWSDLTRPQRRMARRLIRAYRSGQPPLYTGPREGGQYYNPNSPQAYNPWLYPGFNPYG